MQKGSSDVVISCLGSDGGRTPPRGNPTLFLFSHLLSTCVLVFAFIFTFIFVVCFDVCCYFSISSLGAMEERTSRKEIQSQNNSTNEEKNATDANSR